MQRFVLAAILGAASLPVLALPTYKFSVLGPLAAQMDLNNSGVGVGYSYVDDSALVYSAQGASKLALPSSIVQSDAWGINDHGTIVGSAGTSPYDSTAYVYANGTYRDLGPLAGVRSFASAVNNAGSVLVNYVKASGGPSYSYVWSEAGGMVDLGSLGRGDTQAFAINERGQIAGTFRANDGKAHVFLWSDGEMTDIGSFNGRFGTSVTGITEDGVVYGNFSDSEGAYAFMIKDGLETTLYDLSEITYIDAAGRMYAQTQRNGPVIIENGIETRLADITIGSEGWNIGMGQVNAAGQILTNACRSRSECYTVLMSPVPEPTTYAMFLAGVGVLAGIARRRSHSPFLHGPRHSG